MALTKLSGSCKKQHFCFSHPDYTVGPGITPGQPTWARRLYCRWGIAPRPETDLLLVNCITIFYKCKVLIIHHALHNYSSYFTGIIRLLR